MKSLLTILVLLTGAGSAHTEDNWPRFRGSKADGVAADNSGLPTKWTATDNVKWVADVPGWGWSCPIVWGGRVFLTTVSVTKRIARPARDCTLEKACAIRLRGFIIGWFIAST